MEFENLIGLPLLEVEKILKSKSINYKILENSSIQKKYDTIIVIKITMLEDGLVQLVTDKFLINI